MQVIQFKPIKPSRTLSAAMLTNALVKGVGNTAKYAQDQFKLTTKTWEEHHPAFSKVINTSAYEITFEVGTSDLIYFFLARGTRVRRAALSRNWISKTAPNWVGSGPGMGQVTSISRRYNYPGIEARNWDDEIADDIDNRHIFAREVQKELDAAVVKSGYAV
jgi:hypothetical protein